MRASSLDTFSRLTEAQTNVYVEEVCRHIAESSAVQQARVDAYLDGATLAAQQVSEVRLTLLEQPAELSGWDFWVNVGMTFLLESNFIGATLKAVTSAVFKPLVRSNLVWLRIPRSPTGQDLVEVAKSAQARLLIEPGRGRLSYDSVLLRGAGALPGRASGDSLRLYHSAIQELVRVTEPLDVVNGLAQAANQARSSSKPQHNDPLAVIDSPGVTVVAAAQSYARATTLGIQVRAARCIAFARTRAAVPDLGELCAGFLNEPLDVKGVTISLDALRRRCAITFEALIWARMYGFSLKFPTKEGRSGPGTPELGSDNDEPFKGVRRQVVDYWLDRFGSEVAAWALRRGWAKMPDQGRLARAIYLRGYLAALSVDLAKTVKPGRGDLTALNSR